MSRADLVERWVKAHGNPPPKGLKRGLLERSAAWDIQARRLGGLSAASRRRLTEVDGGAGRAGSLGAGNGGAAGPPPIGSRLMREWNGRMHIVDVVEGGFAFDGKRYRSLSAIARRITGAHWSGPRFFGL